MKKIISVSLLVIFIFLTGCTAIEQREPQPVAPGPASLPNIAAPENKPSQLCPDNICDDYEKSSGVCPQDCGGISDSPGTPSPQVTQQQSQAQQPIQQTSKEDSLLPEEISVIPVDSKYKTVTSKPGGWFKTGQEADIMLSGMGFNNAGSALLFNHPGKVVSDGTHLLLADRNNNRVLIWNKLPNNNTPPDLVLGQPDFTSNNAGTELNKLNWPVSVAVANGKVVVADTNNERVLIWNSFPTKNGRAADIEIKNKVGWPWAVWTNGKKLVVTATAGANVLVWNDIPTQHNEPADIILTANGDFGTPRSIASDGKHLMIGDHNAKPNNGRGGNFFWKNFPTSDQKYDFFVSEVYRMGEEKRPADAPAGGDVLWGSMTEEGKLMGIANMLYLWDSFPENEQDAADLKVGGVPGIPGYDFGGSQSGDGTNIIYADNKLYLSLANGNKVVGFNDLPTKTDQQPDFAIGAPDIYTNTLETNYLLTNPVVATDGKSLFAGANFGKLYLYVWKNVPDESGAKPDFIYDLKFPPRSIAIFNNMMVVAGGNNVAVWNKVPSHGEKPETIFRGRIGSASFSDIGAVAFDEKHFYLADDATGKIYVWEGFPSAASNPKFSWSVQPKIKSLSSDGKHLAVASGERDLFIYRTDDLSSSPKQLRNDKFNLPTSMLVYGGKLFVADTGFNRVQIWNEIENALADKDADLRLGQVRDDPYRPLLSDKSGLFMPARLAFDGNYLWVGEFKFSGRILRFSVR